MKEKIALTAAMCAAAIATMCGCSIPTPEPPAPKPAVWEHFEAASPGEDILVKAEGGVCRIRWQAEEGTKYVLYRSRGKYSQWERVAEVYGDEYETSEQIYDYYKVCAVENGEEVPVGEPSSAFTPNTLVVAPTDDMEAVQADIDEIHASLETGATGQFSARRAALFFLPGNYPITARVGYYTSVNGLGEVPASVSLQRLYVSNKVLDRENATCTFWRSVENVEVQSSVTWAVSQATSMRRTQIDGSLALSYSGWSSGGFLANSLVTGNINSGTQQQWFCRNDEFRAFNGGNYNMVFSGCIGDLPSKEWTETGGSVTDVEQTERIAEKPFLYRSGEEYRVFVPLVQENTQGITWKQGFLSEMGLERSLSDFYIADARYDDEISLNAALAAGKDLLLTPGVYSLDAPLNVTREGTVVLGIGYATLKISDTNTDCALRVGDVGGVRIADILVDAGKYSKNMVVVGEEFLASSHEEDPIVLSDLYLRIGGVANVHTETETALLLYANDVIGDNFWIWRADHSQGVAWEDTEHNGSVTYGNPAQTGLEVVGDNVICYALMVEHFENYQTIWRGENGMTLMYQSETPYVVPGQSAWTSHNGTKNGCSSYKVADDVLRHRAYGIGIYLVNSSGVELASAIEVPEGQGIDLRHLVTACFSGQNGSHITNVVNDYGGAVSSSSSRRNVVSYPLR